jgi:hypothetical protein
MMDCTHFRDVLDCYVDDELSAEARADAAAHLRDCAACARAATELATLRVHVRQAVNAHAPPADLERRIRQAIGPRPGIWPATRGRAAALASAALVLVAVFVYVVSPASTRVRDTAASVMDRAVVRLSAPGAVVLEGVVLCRDCELEKRYGISAPCQSTGHHGAIATGDGRIWNIIDHPPARALIHDDSLHGRTVRVRARIVRPAGTIAVDSYEILG